MTETESQKIRSFCLIAAAVIGILIQIQASFMASHGGYLGLRLNLADLILPFAGLFVCFTLAKKQSIFPKWQLRGAWFWLIALSLLFIAALIHGHSFTGEWSRWAIANKFVGWFVIVAYFCLGGWLATNGGTVVRDIFLRFFILTFCLIATGTLVVLYLNDLGLVPPLSFGTYPLNGLMGNRNALALLTACIFIAATMKNFLGHGLLPRTLMPFVSFLLPILFIEIGSRMGWIVTIIAFSALVLTHPKKIFVCMLPYIFVGIATLSVMHHFSGKPLFREHQFYHATLIVEHMNQKTPSTATSHKLFQANSSEDVRLNVVHNAITLWLTDPLFGTGLGSFLAAAHKKYDSTGAIIDLIDSTPLWLLTETGVVGLSLFSAFYIAVIYALWARRKTDPWAGIMLAVLLAFALMSLMHEILLTRFIWFMLGLSLAQSRLASKNAKQIPSLEH